VVRSFSWWHWLWTFIFFSGLVFRIRGVDEIGSSPVDSAALIRLALEFACFVVLVTRLALRKTEWLRSLFSGPIGLLTVYALVSLVSTAWSAFPAWTAFKSLEYLLDVVLIAAILSTINTVLLYKTLLDWTWVLTGFALLSVWLGVLLAPELALKKMQGLFGWQIQGVIPAISADSVGELGAIMAIVSFGRLMLHTSCRVSNRIWYSTVLFIGCITMFFAQARTAIAGFGLGAICVLILSRRWILTAVVGLLSTLAAIPLLLSGWLQAYIQRGDSAERIASLSSRLDWWQFAWDKFSQQPFTGYGAYAAGRFVVMADLQRSTTATMHSDWVEIIVGTGLWGLLPAMLSLMTGWWVLLSTVRNPLLEFQERALTVEAIAVLAMLSLRSVFNNTCFWHPPLVFLAVLGYAELMRRNRIRELAVVPELNMVTP
jgi:O-antigen ligase